MIDICTVQPNKISANTKSKFFFFHGEPGTWKTTVASQFPKSLLLGFEIGYQFIDGVRAVPMTTWSDVKDLYRQLKTNKAKEMYDTIIFDTVSNAYQMCYNYVLGQFGVDDPGKVPFGKGWRAIREEFGILKNISKLGYGLVFIAHSKESEITNEKTGQVTIKVKSDLDKSAIAIVNELVDFTLYVRKEVVDDEGNEQVFAYSELANVETKRRLKTFPQRTLFTYENLMEALYAAIKEHARVKETSTENNRIFEEESFDSIKQEVISLATDLLAETSSVRGEATRYIVEMFDGVKLSETTQAHKGKLIAARDYFKDLAEQLG